MFKRFRFSYLIVLLIIPALVLSACSLGGNKAKGDQVLNLPETQEPPNLDSAKSTDVVSSKILNNTMEGLYRNGENGKLVLGMAAEEPKVSADKMTYTFKIRDAKWSDGKPVRAQDFVYGWTRALKKETASEYANILYPVKNAQAYNEGKVPAEAVGVKAIDEKTLEVNLERPLAYIKDLLTFTTYFPQRQDIVEKFGDKYALEASNLVFNGPFQLSKWKHNEMFQYTKNDQYWDKETVKLKEVNTLIVKDTQTSLNLYKKGKVDYTLLDAEFVDSNKDNKEKIVLQEAATSYIELNERQKLWTNAKTRKAINVAIDKELLVNNVLKNGSVPAGGLVPPSVKAGDNEFRANAPVKAQFNPAEAKKLWAEGLKELGIPNPTKISLLGDNHDLAKKVEQFLQAQLKENLGLNIEITSVPFKQRLKRAEEGDFELLLSGWMGDYNDPMTFMDLFPSGNSFNHGKWSNKAYDVLIEKAEKNTDVEARVQDFVGAEKILIDDTGIAPLYWKSRTALLKPFVKGMVWHIVGPEYDLKWASIDTK